MSDRCGAKIYCTENHCDKPLCLWGMNLYDILNKSFSPEDFRRNVLIPSYKLGDEFQRQMFDKFLENVPSIIDGSNLSTIRLTIAGDDVETVELWSKKIFHIVCENLAYIEEGKNNTALFCKLSTLYSGITGSYGSKSKEILDNMIGNSERAKFIMLYYDIALSSPSPKLLDMLEYISKPISGGVTVVVDATGKLWKPSGDLGPYPFPDKVFTFYMGDRKRWSE